MGGSWSQGQRLEEKGYSIEINRQPTTSQLIPEGGGGSPPRPSSPWRGPESGGQDGVPYDPLLGPRKVSKIG